MKATVVTVRDPFHPSLRREFRTIGRPRRIGTLAPKTEQPFIAVLNGEPILRKHWNTVLRDGDHLTFRLMAQGGGDSDPLQIVLMIAVIVVAPYLAPGMLMTQMAIRIGGMMLINALIEPPKPPSTQQAAAMAAPSPTYDLAAQGNYARLKSAIPVQYGRMRFPPDFAAQPYAEYAGNEQYLYQLFCLGQGYFDVEAITIEDTPIANFSEITYELVPPNGRVTLYPANVVTSVEVAGQEALTSTALGPFVANAAGTVVNALAIDVVCPKGLFYAQDDGSLGTKSVTFQVQARPIDNAGAPLAGYSTLGTETISGATNTPQRRSYRYIVAEGRYEVRLTRIDAKDTSNRAGHDLNWVGLRAYLPGNQVYGNVTMLAMRMRASNNLSQAASRKVFVTATRKIKTWSVSSGWSASEVATRSIAWAIADAARNIDYGAELPDIRISLAELAALDAIWTSRGDHFDARFDNALSFWEAVTQIAKAGRAKPYLQGGLLHVARDGTQTLPVALFNMRNIVRGSFSVDYTVTNSSTADAIDASYFDETLWATRPVRAKLTGSTEQNIADVDMFGIINRAHAWRESMYQLAATKYRPKTIRFSTEMEGFIPSFGDLIAVSHDMPQWGQTAEAVSWNAGTRTLRVSEPITFTTGTHYIGLARRDNSVNELIAVTAGVDAYTLVLAASPDFTPYTGDAEERTRVSVGPGEAWSQLALVASVRPKGLHQVEIECVNYDNRVNTADSTGGPTSGSTPTLPTVPTVPAIGGTLTVMVGGTVDAPVLYASWQAAAGANSYLVEHSRDGVLWTRVAEVSTTSYSFTVFSGAHWLRVAPLGASRGAWMTWSGNVAGGVEVSTPTAPTGLVAVATQNGIVLSGWSTSVGNGHDFFEVLRNTVNNSAGAQVIGTVSGPANIYADNIGSSGQLRYYWVRSVNIRGVRGALSNAANATTGVVTDAIPGVDTVTALHVVAGSLTGNELAANSVNANRLIVGSLNAASGIIAALTVGTLELQNQAVTIPLSITTAPAVVAVNNPVASLIIASTGAPILVVGAITFDSYFNGGAAGVNRTFQLRRNGVVLQKVVCVNPFPATLDDTDAKFVISDTPGAGNHTYSLHYLSGGVNISGAVGAIGLIETKK